MARRASSRELTVTLTTALATRREARATSREGILGEVREQMASGASAARSSQQAGPIVAAGGEL